MPCAARREMYLPFVLSPLILQYMADVLHQEKDPDHGYCAFPAIPSMHNPPNHACLRHTRGDWRASLQWLSPIFDATKTSFYSSTLFESDGS